MAVVITKPTSGAALQGTVLVEATFSGKNFDIATATIDGIQVASDAALPVALSVDTTKVADGLRTLTVAVRYRTAAGRLRWQKASIPVTVKNAVAAEWTWVANGDESFTLAQPSEVRYGAGSVWASKILGAGTHRCDNATFGGDPVPNVYKSCQARPTSEPVPVPDPGGVALDSFSDFGATINRFKPKPGPDHWWNYWETGTPYANGGGVFEVSTPHGPGFRFKVTGEMTVPSGGQMALITDTKLLGDAAMGRTEEWWGKFMLPSAGNAGGFPGGWRGVIWECGHTATMSGNHVSIDRVTERLKFAVYDPATQNYRDALDPRSLQLDHWYSWRIRLKWSWGADGFFQGWLDGQQLANFTGATLKNGERPNHRQFGFYCGNHPGVNECLHAAIRAAL